MRRLEQRHQLGVAERFAGHRARRPSIQEDRVDRIFGLADVAASLHLTHDGFAFVGRPFRRAGFWVSVTCSDFASSGGVR